MTSTDVLIVGTGISGLGCRALLQDQRDVLTLEAADRPGGLTRVFRVGEFIFDSVVHVLRFRDPELWRFAQLLCPDGFHHFPRINHVWQAGVQLDYPYQYHAGQLPEAIRKACLEGYIHNPWATAQDTRTFRDWLLKNFGPGFYEHFFHPYNLKLYGVGPECLEGERMTWLIPDGDRERVLEGSRDTVAAGAAGSQLAYPRGTLGIETLCHGAVGLAESPILVNQQVVHLDLAQRVLQVSSGQRYAYRELVSSIPLPGLLALIPDLDHEIAALGRSLKAVPLQVAEVGIEGEEHALAGQWSYFPDPDIPFYRLTRLEHVSPELCPAGHSALLLESSAAQPLVRDEVEGALRRVGMLAGTRVVHYRVRRIPAGYVLFEPGVVARVRRILEHLRERHVHPIGRYGRWDYMDIEGALATGLETAAFLRGGQLRSLLGSVPGM
ncbi:MAG: NAD(P)-binding protein [Candidatus Delongbacteria bacterium]|nr:NAD(P)-binding protein [Candidatus Delongbacteria bacterium]